jgi:Methyltransferase domain
VSTAAVHDAPAGEDLRDDPRFLAAVVERIEGWLDRYAALRTIDLLQFQEAGGVRGPVYEVGLYHGKYFAVLLRSAVITGDRAVGIDSFDYVPRERFDREFVAQARLDELRRIGPVDLRILDGPSRALSDADVMTALGSPARFISIDGSHEHDDVHWDLQVAGRLLSEAGVIAADDYLNPACLGVNEAINRFLIATPDVVPFAHVANKLFLARPNWAEQYRLQLEQCILADPAEPRSEFYRQQIAAGGRRNVEPILFGRRVMSIPL